MVVHSDALPKKPNSHFRKILLEKQDQMKYQRSPIHEKCCWVFSSLDLGSITSIDIMPSYKKFQKVNGFYLNNLIQFDKLLPIIFHNKIRNK